MLDLNGDAGKIVISMVLGTAVGLERELSDKPAGLKTNVLICLGSTIFTMLSVRLAGDGADPARVTAQIVSGIGFLGAGAIMREGEHVTGLTTAAIIWVVAAIGMGVGLGFHSVAGLATLGTLAVQVGLSRLDSVVDNLRQRLTYRIVTPADQESIESVASVLDACQIRVVRRKVTKHGRLYHSEWLTYGPPVRQAAAARGLMAAEKVIEVLY